MRLEHKLKKLHICIALLVVWSFNGYAQSRGLKVGDIMPEYTFSKIVNYKKNKLTTKELKGKIIILDFWYSGCSNCIELMPSIQLLQNTFKDKIQIILVNDYKGDNVKKVNEVIERVRRNTGQVISLPINLNDTVLNNYFPSYGNPHDVIISATGEILGITGPEEITKKNIQSLLNGKKMVFPLKDDFWDLSLPILDPSNNFNGKIYTYSSLTGYSTHYVNGFKTNLKGEKIGMIETNIPLIAMYKRAYPEIFIKQPLIIYDCKDSYFKFDYGSLTNLFTYDITIFSGKFTREKYEYFLRQDLDRAFEFSLKQEKRVVPVLLINLNNQINKFITRYSDYSDPGNLNEFKIASKNQIEVKANKFTPIGIVKSLNANTLFGTLEVIDDASVNKEVDIVFPVGFDFNNKEELISFLHEHGIDLTVENRELDCVIVSDKKPGEPTILN